MFSFGEFLSQCWDEIQYRDGVVDEYNRITDEFCGCWTHDQMVEWETYALSVTAWTNLHEGLPVFEGKTVYV